jgi:hypothetical protein
VRPLANGLGPIIVIYDDLLSATESTYQWWLHALSEMRVDHRTRTVHIAQNHANLDVLFLSPTDLQFAQTDEFSHSPGEGYADQWHLAAETLCASQSARFLIVLLPFPEHRSQEPRTVELLQGDGYLGVEISAQARCHVVLFRSGGDPDTVHSAGGAELRGVVTACSWDAAENLIAAKTIP